MLLFLFSFLIVQKQLYASLVIYCALKSFLVIIVLPGSAGRKSGSLDKP